MRKKTLHRVSAQILNSLLLFSILIPNLLSPVVVIAQDLDLAKTDSIAEIPTDESEDILEEGISTSIFEEGIYTVFPVEEKEYVYPEDERVRIKFTSITEEGDLRISKVLLSEEEKELLNTTDTYAWDFTSTMANGSFTYDLVLPNDQGEDIEVKYTEDGGTYTPIENVIANEGVVKIVGLDHFTMFVVVPAIPADVTEGTTQVDSSCNVSIGSGMFCFDTIQEAIDAAINGDTINVLAGEYYISNTILVNKELTLTGESGAKLINIDTPAKSVFSITSSNVIVQGFEITHQNSFPTDHLEVLYALISIPDNANLTNIEIKNNFIYGSDPIGTLHKNMHTRGITVGTSGATNLNITDNTIHSVRNGIVIRPTNTTNTTGNTIYNTKGGIMLYTSSFADADNRTILNNTWTDAHNEWDIVWNSATYGFPDYQQSVIELGNLNNNAFVLDLRRETTTVIGTLVGNRNPVFVTTAGTDVTHQSTGNMNEPFKTIQFAVEKVANNGTIYVKNGNYEEQVIIDSKNLAILGESQSNTVIQSPLSLTTTFESLKPLMSIHNSSIVIKDLTIDGLGRGNGNYKMVGLGLMNSSANLANLSIINIKETPANGSQHGVGLYVYNSDGVTREVNADALNIHDYQKNGVNMRGVGLKASLSDSLVYGFGDIDFIAQNGIQYSEGATGLIQNNEIYGNLYTPSSWAATGILPFNAGPNLKIINNKIHNNGWGGIYAIGVGENFEISNNHIYDNLGDAIILYGGSFENSVIKGNTIEGNDYGIWIDSGISSSLNITENLFDNKEQNASDESNYFYDNGTKGNYWSDYLGFDMDGDGIGEKPYDIDTDSKDRYPLTNNLLSSKVNFVEADKDYYKSGDVLSIQVEVTNDGSVQLDPNSEQLVVNITNPSGSYISGTFRQVVPLNLLPGETKTFTFYSLQQTIPNTWANGTYRVYTSIYSQRSYPLSYILGGQNSSETFIVDSTKPSTPEVLGFNNPTTQCGGYTNVKNTTVDWSDSDGTGSPIKGYEYQINYPTTSGTRGLWTVFFNGANSQYSGSLNEGRHYIRVRAQDMAGNWSNWSQDWLTPSTLTTDEMQNNCSIELDTIVPEIPTGLYFWDVDNNKEVMCGGYSNTKHIKEYWDPTSDINFYKYEYSSFNAPTGSAGLVSSPFFTNYFDSSWWNIPMEGTYGFQVRTVDLAGNISGWSLDGPYGFSSSCKIIIDWTPPSVEITNPSDTEYVKGTVDFRGTIQDSNLLRYYYSIEGVKSQTITTSTNLLDETIYTWDTTAKPDGEYEMRLEARDKANNKDNNISVDVINVIVDNTIPTVSTLDDFAILEGSTIPTKEVLAEDNFEIEKFCYSIQSDLGDHPNTCIFPSVETNSWNIDLTATILTELNNSYGINTLVADTSLIPEGDYTITYYSRDMAGNESNPHTFVVTIENVLPSLIFSSDSTVITEGNNVIFNGSFTDPGLDDSDWTYTLSFGDGTPDVTGSTPVIGQILSNVSHQYSAVGVFTAELEVCESSALCASEDIEITVDPIILPTETGEVAGATDTVKSPTIIKKVTTYVSDLFGIGSGDEDFEEEGEEVSSPEVKGSQTCENPSKISGYIYVDSNKNGEKDSDEKIYTDIPVRIYTKDDGTEETVKELTSDENGYWETTLCTGEYFVEIDESKLPDNFNIEENTLGVEIVENEDVTIDFAILDERNFLQKYWIWILVILGLVTLSGILLFGQNKKKTF